MGSGTSGEVYSAMNVKNGSIFAVKQLNIISMSSGVDKEAIIKLRVSSLNLKHNVRV